VYVVVCLFPKPSGLDPLPNSDPISERQRIAHSHRYTHPRPMPQLRKMLARMLSSIPEPNIPPPTPEQSAPGTSNELWAKVPSSDTCIRIQSSRLISERGSGMCSGTPVVGLKCIQLAPRHLWKGGRQVGHFVAVLWPREAVKCGNIFGIVYHSVCCLGHSCPSC
jgi:hypothetical protein